MIGKWREAGDKDNVLSSGDVDPADATELRLPATLQTCR